MLNSDDKAYRIERCIVDDTAILEPDLRRGTDALAQAGRSFTTRRVERSFLMSPVSPFYRVWRSNTGGLVTLQRA
jgi:hypothetical protein